MKFMEVFALVVLNKTYYQKINVIVSNLSMLLIVINHNIVYGVWDNVHKLNVQQLIININVLQIQIVFGILQHNHAIYLNHAII